MKHLFIINPAAKWVKGKEFAIKNGIISFFREYPDIKYDIYITEWSRDAVSYIKMYIDKNGKDSGETIRFHSIGGSGLLFEVLNGVMGFDNAEIASYPYGKSNNLIRYFGKKNMKLFTSLKNQVFSKTVLLDVVRCGNNYGICYGKSGLDSSANLLGDVWISKGMPITLSYVLAGVYNILCGKHGQRYDINIDGEEISCEIATIIMANAPCYAKSMSPAIHAHPDDGVLDVYFVKKAPKLKLLLNSLFYAYGIHHRISGILTHKRAKKIKLSSDETMCMSIDSEIFFGASMECEVIPKAVRFVLPDGIDMSKLPLIFNRPKEGLRGE
ncbi:MAG: hypothetical protein FWC36_00260 [Spirochaetes bacterium]|nr:hypothetical protein [Spirochaetota bacterium]